MFYMSMTTYALGPPFAHPALNRSYLVAASLAAIWIALGTNLVGVRIGKWTGEPRRRGSMGARGRCWAGSRCWCGCGTELLRR